jgi:glutathione S-transferase
MKLQYMNSKKPVLIEEDLYACCNDALDAFEIQLGQKDYLFGEYPSLADACLCAIIEAILIIYKDTYGSKLNDLLKKHEGLVKFAKRNII